MEQRCFKRADGPIGYDGTILGCTVCGLIQRCEPLPEGMVAECCRCGSLLAKSRSHSLDLTAALALSALVLYVPANIYPILRMSYHGIYSANTVWDGVVKLYQDGNWFVAIVVFLASIVIPMLKLLGLFFLVTTTRLKVQRWRSIRTWIHRVIEAVGPWAMLDVFMLSILVALVKLGQIATVTPGPGLLPFTLVVVLTILASATFEPRQIWEGLRENHDDTAHSRSGG